MSDSLRHDGDEWDLASSVGATATMVAAARAIASKESDPIIDDPYADPLVRAVGVDFFVKLVDGTLPLDDEEADAGKMLADVMAVRTRFFDDFFLDAGRAGIRQAVILASGLDSRAYRLPWPTGTSVFEIDQPAVLGAKSAALADLGATPTAERHAVAVDLRDDWPAALVAAGFDAGVPTAWSAEGLLVYLPPEAQDRLFDDITAVSAPGSRLATEYHPDGGAALGGRATGLADKWRAHGFDVDVASLAYGGERTPVADYLTGKGWHVSARPRPDVFADYGRQFPDSEALEALRNSLSVIATFEGERS
ncbi:class I SAM-dependent methyltransferase [Mycobacterium yunnanensis]|uniref:S-adenosyl-L-methionine-dependent methyltransferase n=1 Tax=Mycobacterium yunnanensis TaxID=368477 RepID=A0A9X2Z1G1_9MYCO|nr:class I SAM-dependent methyltransferase [Mycobacterium yunnanensis]MCV7421634.1 class I SAM-dependent methyltransferase [Mycobacterium yunnanensis]